MRIGITVLYGNSAATYAATMLAHDLAARGVLVDFFSESSVIPSIDPVWDRHVHRDLGRHYVKWAVKHDSIISFCPISLPALRFLHRRGVHTVAVAPPQLGLDIDSLKAFNRVVAPSVNAKEVLSRLGVRTDRLACIPWDCGIISSVMPKPSDRILIAIPGDDLDRVPHVDIIQILNLIQIRRLKATLWYNRKRLTAVTRPVYRRAEKLCTDNGRFIEFLDDYPYWAAPELFASHAVTMLPTRFSPFSLTACWSVRCGTPIVAYAVPPCNQLPASSGIFVPTETTVIYNRIVAADDGNDRMFEYLVGAAARFVERDRFVPDPAIQRMVRFRRGWDNVLGLG
jgi:hypothetical protein